jgi:hypothetical protein
LREFVRPSFRRLGRRLLGEDVIQLVRDDDFRNRGFRKPILMLGGRLCGGFDQCCNRRQVDGDLRRLPGSFG